MRAFRHLLGERGAGPAEYLVLLILVALVVLGLIRVFGDTVKAKLTDSQEHIDTMEQDQRRRRIAEASRKPLKHSSSKPGDKDGKKATGSGSSGTAASNSGSQASASGGAGSGEKGIKGGVGEKQNNKARDHRDYIAGAKEEEEAGFNPFILLIIAGIVGFLFFIIIKGNKEGAAAG